MLAGRGVAVLGNQIIGAIFTELESRETRKEFGSLARARQGSQSTEISRDRWRRISVAGRRWVITLARLVGTAAAARGTRGL